MSRFGIQTSKALGVSIPQIRDLAKKIGIDHELAQQLWITGIHEARILATMVDDPAKVSEGQMDKWALDFDSWDVVDGCCGNLFDKTKFAIGKAHEWSKRKEEYVKRAGFVLMAELAVHDKKASNKTFLDFLPVIVREASDERNFVKKAVNWAVRQIGKRNSALNAAAIRHKRPHQKETCRCEGTRVQMIGWVDDQVVTVGESYRKNPSSCAPQVPPCSRQRSSFLVHISRTSILDI